MWMRKTKHHFKPKYYDNRNHNESRRWDPKIKRFTYNTQDPLFFDYDKLYINKGIQPFVDKILATGRNDVPLNKRAYVIYHMGKQGVYDPAFFNKMEESLPSEPTSTTDENG